MKKFAAILLMALVVVVAAQPAFAQSGAPATQGAVKSGGNGGANLTEEDRQAIKNVALDYAFGYYEGDGERMERALHPDLAKRIVQNNPQGRSSLGQMSAMTLVQIARSGSGKNTPAEQRLAEVTILDSFGGMAAVRLEMQGWVDYMQIGKWNGQWRIVNVLWDMKPRQQ